MAKRRKQRRRRSRQEWEQLVEEYQSSDMTQREFAQTRGVGMSSLERWIRLLRREAAEVAEQKSVTGLVELVAQAPTVSSSRSDDGRARVLVGTAVCLELSQWPSPEYVALLARAYEAASPC